MRHLFALLKHAKAYKKEYILGPIFKVLEAIFELIIPLVIADMIDRGVNAGDSAYIYRSGALLAALSLIGFSSTLVCQFMASRAAQGTGTVLRGKLFSHIMTLSHSQLESFGAPTMISRITGDVNQVQTASAMLIRLAVRAPFLAAGAIVMSAAIDLQLSLILLFAAPLIYLSILFVTRRSRPYFRKMQRENDNMTRITRENISGARVIRAFSAQSRERERFFAAAENSDSASVRAGVISALLNPLTTVIMNAGIILLLVFGGVSVDTGRLSQGELIALLNYINQILLALIVLANIIVIFNRGDAAAERISEVLETKPEITDAEETGRGFDESAPAVRFDGVTFRYNEDAADSVPALSDISFTLPRGGTLGIIGGTGAGKSTLVSLVMRFRDVRTGGVSVMGRDVKDIQSSELREIIGYTPQKAELFSGTVRSNLLWGKPDASDEELISALKTAQALDFIMAKQGLDTRVEAGGRNFSGGQRQRLTIARAIVSKPPIIILDDPSSALDAATDARLRAALKNDLADSAVIIVSQRVASVRNCDNILVLDGGKDKGQGSHGELYRKSPIYREICDSQNAAGEVAV
ncbi:MAG TPA: ABC transporter ATP-binding protein [Clostridiales bacterium]|nr:ABC transporter ATP-binding protein [Clostridiales bacterium]